MGGGRLRNLVVRFGFDGVDQIWKFYRVLNEKDRNVVADKIVIALVGIEFDGESSHVAGQIA